MDTENKISLNDFEKLLNEKIGCIHSDSKLYIEKTVREATIHALREHSPIIIGDIVSKTLLTIGINLSDPIETQEMIAYIKQLKKNSEIINKQKLTSITRVLINAFISFLIAGTLIFLSGNFGKLQSNTIVSIKKIAKIK